MVSLFNESSAPFIPQEEQLSQKTPEGYTADIKENKRAKKLDRGKFEKVRMVEKVPTRKG